jgi:hypothetical protein
MLLLVRYSFKGGEIPAEESQKLVLVQDEMVKELKKLGKTSLLSDYLTKGTIPMDDLVAILDSVKSNIKKPVEATEQKKCIVQ